MNIGFFIFCDLSWPRGRCLVCILKWLIFLHSVPREPLFNPPQERDMNFVGRETILNELLTTLTDTSEHHRRALVGLGGVGYVKDSDPNE
jgi:hypothetical protein